MIGGCSDPRSISASLLGQLLTSQHTPQLDRTPKVTASFGPGPGTHHAPRLNRKVHFNGATRCAVRRRRDVGRLQLPSRSGVAPRLPRCRQGSTVLANFGPDRAVWLRTRPRSARRRLTDAHGSHVKQLHTKYFADYAPACAPSSWCTRTARGCRRTGLALSARHIGRRGRAGAAAKRARLRRPHLRGHIIGRRRAAQSRIRRSSPLRCNASRRIRRTRSCSATPSGMCSRPDAPASRPLRCSAAGSPARPWSTRAPWPSMTAHPRCVHTSTSSPNSLGRNGFRRWPISPSAPTAARPVRICARCPRPECRRTGTRDYRCRRSCRESWPAGSRR